MHRTEHPRHRALRLLLLGVIGLVLACGGSEKSPGAIDPGDATLRLVVSGLPAGTAARVRLTRPSGAVNEYTATTELHGLPAGTYGISAGYVNAENQTWTAALAGSSIVLADNDSTDVPITYVGGPAATLNLSIGYVQLIQSTQRSDGSIPMIAGRDVLLRVFVQANGANTAQPGVRVRLYDASTQVDSILVLAPGSAVPTTVDTGSITSSWNILIPGGRVSAGARIQVEVDPDDLVPETDKSNNRWPGGTTVSAIPLRAVDPFALRFVPVRISANSTTGAVGTATKDALARMTQNLYPLSAVTVSVRSTFTTSAPVLQSNDENNSWGQILSEIAALRSADHGTADYVGIVPVTYGSGIAGLGYIGAPIAIAWDRSGSAPGVIAHEVGHNFGRNHAPCGNPGGPDGAYPYAEASIVTWGIDIATLQLKPPGGYKDLMSYCNPTWVSDYTYLGVANFRDAQSAIAASSAATPVDGLLIWGRVVNGNVILEPVIPVMAPARLPQRTGRNKIEGFGADGERIFSLSFDGDLVADLPHGEERHFAYVVPLTGAERSRLTTLALSGQGLTARRQRPAALREGGPITAPTVSMANGVVRWNGLFPMAVVRDQASGEIVGLGRAGSASFDNGGLAVTVELLDGLGAMPAQQ